MKVRGIDCCCSNARDRFVERIAQHVQGRHGPSAWLRRAPALVVLLAYILLLGPAEALAQDLLDNTFIPPVEAAWNASTTINTVALQPDGKMIIGGSLLPAGDTRVRGAYRLNQDGALDTTFAPVGTSVGNATGLVSAILVQPDGKILIGGTFTKVDDQPANLIARLNADGTLDTAFAPNILGNNVSSLALQSDGRILIAGSIAGVGGVTRPVPLIRVNQDGSLDPSFALSNNDYGLSCGCTSVAQVAVVLRSDGKVLLGGESLYITDDSGNYIGDAPLLRINTNGMLDTDLSTAAGLNNSVTAMFALPDGGLLVSGTWNGPGVPVTSRIARLNADDTLDTGFADLSYSVDNGLGGVFDGYIRSILVQPNGKVIVSGRFNRISQSVHANVARLNADGSLDPTFDPSGIGAEAGIGDLPGNPYWYLPSFDAIAVQTDGRISVAGFFAEVGASSVPRFRVARLLGHEPAAQQLGYGADSHSLRWQRSGSGMELSRSTFESSTDGSHWNPLGEGVWSAGTWGIDGLELPTGTPLWVRARGFASTGSSIGTNPTSGYGSGGFSGSLFESVQQLAARVTPNSGPGGSIAPSSPQFVNTGSTLSFVITPDAGQQILGVAGTCGGTLAGNTFTTASIGADCTVVVSFTAATNHVVTSSAIGGGSISPSTAQVVADGSTASFTVAADAHASLNNVSGCGGVLAGMTYTTGPIGGNCTVSAVFAIDTFTVTPSADAGGSVDPAVPQTVDYGSELTFTIVPDTHHHVSVVGTCAGWLNQDGATYVYITEPVDHDCALSVSFPIDTFTVTPSIVAPIAGPIGGTIAPATPTAVAAGSTQIFNVMPDAGYDVDVGGSCGGTLQGVTYETNPIYADCTVEIAFIAVAGADSLLDTSFNPPAAPQYSADSRIATVATQPDGKILVGGFFIDAFGRYIQVLRLQEDGSVDPNFAVPGNDTGTSSGDAHAIVVQPDGKILVAGNFTRINNQPSNGVVRLNSDGSVDTSFNLDPRVVDFFGVSSVLVQPDGEILIAGSFFVDGISRAAARLNSDGSLDPSFTFVESDYGFAGAAGFGLMLSPDGEIILGGYELGQFPDYYSLVRLNADGSVDADLSSIAGAPAVPGTNNPTVSALALQPDGRILVGRSDGHIVRINADDTRDFSFADAGFGDASGFNCGCIYSIVVQPSGKILVAGIFNTVLGMPHINIVRLNANGLIDDTFDPTGQGAAGYPFPILPPGSNSYATFNAMAVQPNGEIVVAGDFKTIGLNPPVPRQHAARIRVPEAAVQRLGYAPSDHHSVQWQRSGSGSEFYRVTFEYSTDGSSWNVLGDGAWNAGVWHLDGLDLPDGGPLWLRARGFASTGGSLGSGGSISESVQQLIATVTPSSEPGGTISPSIAQFVDTGSTASFTITPDAGQQILGVNGTCGGVLNGQTFTTLPVSGDCTVIATFTSVNDHVVTPIATAGGSITPSTPQIVGDGDTTTFTVSADEHATLASVSGCGGVLVGSIYTTGPIIANCTVSAVFAIDAFTVTPSAGTGGTINPATPQTVNYGDTLTLALTPDAYHYATVAGTCGGSLDSDGTTYVTNPISADCTVAVSFPSHTFTVTPILGLNGQVAPSTAQTIDGGTSAVFTVTPNAGYAAAVTGTCGGSLQGTTYTTNPITADCTVVIDFLASTYTVTPTAGAHGAITPSTPQSAAFGGVLSFLLAPEVGYVAHVGGTCGGTLSGNVFVTAQISADCTVQASFSASGDAIFANGFEVGAP